MEKIVEQILYKLAHNLDWQLGLIALVILFLWYTTDMSYNALRFFINLIQPRAINPNEQENESFSKFPTHPRKIPISAIIEHFRKRKTILIRTKKNLKEKIFSSSWFFEEIGNLYENDNNVNFNRFKSRDNIPLCKKLFTIVNGLPGTGKTTFVLNWLKNNLNADSDLDFIIYFDFLKDKTLFPVLVNENINVDDLNIWKDINKSVINDFNDEPKRPSSNLLSYYLNWGYTYIVINDINSKADLLVEINNLKIYLRKYHKRNWRLRIIITSRYLNSKDFARLNGLSVVTIKSLTQRETEEFFYKKCKEQNIDLQTRDFFDLVEPKTSLLRFENEYARNPLFVEIIVYIVKTEGFRKLTDVFQKSIAHVYRKFIKCLYSNNDEELYDAFFLSFKKLAYAATMRNKNEFDFELISEIFSGIKINNNSDQSVNANFLTVNGFLKERDVRDKILYSFIHQTIRDIFYVDHIVSNRNYIHFTGVSEIGEEYIYYLREELVDRLDFTGYCDLLKVNIVIAGKIIDHRFIECLKKEHTDFFNLIIQIVCEKHVFEDSGFDLDIIDKYLQDLPIAKELKEKNILNMFDKRESLNERCIKFLLYSENKTYCDYLSSRLFSGKTLISMSTLVKENEIQTIRFIEKFLPSFKFSSNTTQLIEFLLSKDIHDKINCKIWFFKN